MSRLFVRLVEAIDSGAFPQSRKWVWRRIYNVMSTFWRDDEWRFMNYGYIPPGLPFALDSDDEPERAFIGLYQQAVADLPLAGARVLEIGSGRGGGARYMARYYDPASVVGLDYSQKTVKRAQALNEGEPGLSFEVGDAEKLPFADASVDIVVNIESSHCYANVPAFAA
ncbi:MAG: class I SAM-dependent methyltransferase, partial [Beijerinckiaceae bacterium]|nr:class I SAM-dependent methyltransferase [Beijerinckiaceae bacterium]